MADLGIMGGFDANKVEPVTRSVIPNGDYDAIIVASEWKDVKESSNKYLELKLQIISGQFQNRMVWDRLNIINSSAEASQIAKGTLSAICRAVGVMNPNRSEELHGRPLRITVKVKSSEQYGQSNEVKAYKARHAGAPAPTPATVAPQAGAPVASQDIAASPW